MYSLIVIEPTKTFPNCSKKLLSDATITQSCSLCAMALAEDEMIEKRVGKQFLNFCCENCYGMYLIHVAGDLKDY